MKKPRCQTSRTGFVLCAAILGALTGSVNAQPGPPGVFAPPPVVEASVSVGLPGVEIRVASDFYEPLAPQGEWVVIGSYGRCWRPGHVARDWRPYCNGHWQRTDAGWYWFSDEQWAWATYHYGRWDFSDQYGWYWVPQTQWAPAWVSWHEGGGYVGWAPLQPSVTISVNGFVGFNAARIQPRSYVFVEQRRFLDPIQPSTVVVNNTTIINKTTIISNTKIVNNTVINEGPATTVIEKASGRTVQAVPVRELRQKQEAPVIARQQASTPAIEKKAKSAQTPASGAFEPTVKKTAAAPVASQVERPDVPPRAPSTLSPAGRAPDSKKFEPIASPAPSQTERPGVAPRSSAPLSPTARVTDSKKFEPIPSQIQPRVEVPRPAVIKEPTTPKAAKYAQPSEQPAKKSEKKAQGKPVAPAREKPVPAENNGKAAGEQRQNQKAEDRETPREKPAAPPQSSP